MDTSPRKELEETYMTLWLTKESDRNFINHSIDFFGPHGKYPILSKNEYNHISNFKNNYFQTLKNKEEFFQKQRESKSI